MPRAAVARKPFAARPVRALAATLQPMGENICDPVF
jgi:hypothetical protein